MDSLPSSTSANVVGAGSFAHAYLSTHSRPKQWNSTSAYAQHYAHVYNPITQSFQQDQANLTLDDLDHKLDSTSTFVPATDDDEQDDRRYRIAAKPNARQFRTQSPPIQPQTTAPAAVPVPVVRTAQPQPVAMHPSGADRTALTRTPPLASRSAWTDDREQRAIRVDDISLAPQQQPQAPQNHSYPSYNKLPHSFIDNTDATPAGAASSFADQRASASQYSSDAYRPSRRQSLNTLFQPSPNNPLIHNDNTAPNVSHPMQQPLPLVTPYATSQPSYAVAPQQQSLPYERQPYYYPSHVPLPQQHPVVVAPARTAAVPVITPTPHFDSAYQYRDPLAHRRVRLDPASITIPAGRPSKNHRSVETVATTLLPNAAVAQMPHTFVQQMPQAPLSYAPYSYAPAMIPPTFAPPIQAPLPPYGVDHNGDINPIDVRRQRSLERFRQEQRRSDEEAAADYREAARQQAAAQRAEVHARHLQNEWSRAAGWSEAKRRQYQTNVPQSDPILQYNNQYTTEPPKRAKAPGEYAQATNIQYNWPMDPQQSIDDASRYPQQLFDQANKKQSVVKHNVAMNGHSQPQTDAVADEFDGESALLSISQQRDELHRYARRPQSAKTEQLDNITDAHARAYNDDASAFDHKYDDSTVPRQTAATDSRATAPSTFVADTVAATIPAHMRDSLANAQRYTESREQRIRRESAEAAASEQKLAEVRAKERTVIETARQRYERELAVLLTEQQKLNEITRAHTKLRNSQASRLW